MNISISTKRTLNFIALLLSMGVFSQQLPDSFTYGSSNSLPSVSRLVQFNDVPVSLHTGIPDVSIPITQIPTRSNDINLNMLLRYHPNTISKFIPAGDLPLKGFTLFYGGMISTALRNTPYSTDNMLGTGLTTSFKYNFMGFSGTFNVVKNNNDFYTFITDNKGGDYIKVTFDYNAAKNIFNSFTLYDSKGYRYIFGTKDYDEFFNAPSTNVINTVCTNYHLTAIYDNNNNKLASFYYQQKLNNEDAPTRKRYTQIISQIVSEGFGKADFVYGNPTYNNSYGNLEQIAISDFYSNTVRKIVDFTEQNKLSFKDSNSNKIEEYQFYYSELHDYHSYPGVIGYDVFGYENFVPLCRYRDDYDRSQYLRYSVVSPKMATNGVLEKIKLPTGGSILYEYESNTYSENRFDAQGNLINEPQNYYNDSNYEAFNASEAYNHVTTNYMSGDLNSNMTFTLKSATTLYIAVEPHPYFSDLSLTTQYPQISLSGGAFLNSIPIYTPDNMQNFCMGKSYTLQPGRYFITLSGDNFGSNYTGSYTLKTRQTKPNPIEWIYGGGVRIKSIGHFETDVPQDYYRSSDVRNSGLYNPISEKKFGYTLFANPSRSSGALIASTYGVFNGEFGHTELVNYSNISVTNTKDNSREEHTFTQATNHTFSLDFWRGVLLDKKIFNPQNQLVLHQEFNHIFYEENVSQIYLPNNVIAKDRMGIARLHTEKTTEYKNGIPFINYKNYDYYNDTNKNLKEKRTSTSLNSQSAVTKYYYHSGDTPYTQNRSGILEKVETYRNTELLATQKNKYVNTFPGNVSYLCQTTQTSKESGNMENRVQYNAYDKYGHPLEMQQENGMKTSYLWGYNKTLVIAKIENASNAQVKSALGVSDLNAVNETSMAAINSLRSHASLSDAMITTYTHKPLVGVSTITDPKGDTVTYEYDSFGRLKGARDRDGNLISENEYHYKP